MIPGIEPLFQQIADSLNRNIPEPWSSAWMEVTYYPHSTEYLTDYVATESGKTKSILTDRSAEKAVGAIRELFRKGGKPLWGRFRFDLQPTGKFNVNWDYDDCDDKGFARWDQDAYLKRSRDYHNRPG